MKKFLSIISAISLTASITPTVISCSGSNVDLKDIKFDSTSNYMDKAMPGHWWGGNLIPDAKFVIILTGNNLNKLSSKNNSNFTFDDSFNEWPKDISAKIYHPDYKDGVDPGVALYLSLSKIPTREGKYSITFHDNGVDINTIINVVHYPCFDNFSSLNNDGSKLTIKGQYLNKLKQDNYKNIKLIDNNGLPSGELINNISINDNGDEMILFFSKPIRKDGNYTVYFYSNNGHDTTTSFVVDKKRVALNSAILMNNGNEVSLSGYNLDKIFKNPSSISFLTDGNDMSDVKLTKVELGNENGENALLYLNKSITSAGTYYIHYKDEQQDENIGSFTIDMIPKMTSVDYFSWMNAIAVYGTDWSHIAIKPDNFKLTANDKSNLPEGFSIISVKPQGGMMKGPYVEIDFNISLPTGEYTISYNSNVTDSVSITFSI